MIYHANPGNTSAVICDIEGNILYLDPPYNHRQYGANYHMLNTSEV